MCAHTRQKRLYSIGGIVEQAGELAGLPFPVHAHMLRHGTGNNLSQTILKA
ncbi:hypothetical protein ACF3DV_33010 (plasmid) [Chlorogloeopsis fritschii PCC 9212]|uniref:Uncharacterized protein n=1 Tax=Chlorogloeopsis fritschii PCC 6912 TaxID=211165 RepID=A0A3S0ZU98_CHLFR|nr:hypothetical protein [Chlorogloeopsis fritschii]MBF2004474.1 hypothetical protein [Chlorogloeopsis fritschii C42_A2020_084]RUR83756.1 hypothetical protein PCC6912_19990 [Chlorogloeopsis fritschii PCC 6912]